MFETELLNMCVQAESKVNGCFNNVNIALRLYSLEFSTYFHNKTPSGRAICVRKKAESWLSLRRKETYQKVTPANRRIVIICAWLWSDLVYDDITYETAMNEK